MFDSKSIVLGMLTMDNLSNYLDDYLSDSHNAPDNDYATGYVIVVFSGEIALALVTFNSGENGFYSYEYSGWYNVEPCDFAYEMATAFHGDNSPVTAKYSFYSLN